MAKTISVLLPLYNEEGNVRPIFDSLRLVFQQLPDYAFTILLVDDGSTDNTLLNIKQIADEYPNVLYLSFSRNFGKENALLAGLQHCAADAVITMDADMQHPPELIPEFIDNWEKGYEVIYAIRKEKNQHAGFISQLNSRIFYSIVNFLSDIKLENGISDFRLLDKKVVAVITEFKEEHPFLRGLVKWIGFRQFALPYSPNPRFSGTSTYSKKALFKLATHGITSFSIKPLTIAIYLGFFFSLLSVLYIPYALISKFIGIAISGWTSVIVTIAFFGGLQLMILGIIGLYQGKAFMQMKQRPQFIIKETNAKSL